jgi:hypothetical protein
MLSTLLVPAVAGGASYEEVINGATCTPYPAYQTSVAVPYSSWMYGFSNGVYCHLTMTQDWRAQDLSYVLFTGSSGGSMSVRLCVHDGWWTVTCSSAKTVGPGNYLVDWVALPSPMPPYPAGAYVQFTFPNGKVSRINELIPVWYK